MPVWCLERALQGRWSCCILILSRSWWIKPIGSKTSGETSRSTACGWFIRQYGAMPLFWQNFHYHWYVVWFWIYFSGHLKLMFTVKWLYSALVPLCFYMVPPVLWEWCWRVHFHDMMQVGNVTTTTTTTIMTTATISYSGITVLHEP